MNCLWLQLRILECLMLVECFVLYQGVRILIQHYREQEKHPGEDDDPPSERNKFVRLALDFGRRLRLLIRNNGEQLRKSWERLNIRTVLRRPVVRNVLYL